MSAVRRFLAQRDLAVLLCAATLLLKLLVPAGYMIGTSHGRVTFELCSGIASEPMAMPGMQGAMPDHGAKDHGKTEMPCAFSGLSVASLGAVNPVQLAMAMAFIVAAGLGPILLPAIVARSYLRPPLRGPPTRL